MSDESDPKPRLIADRLVTVREEIRVFSITAQTGASDAEKREAAARVEISRALLATLETLAKNPAS